MAQLDRILDKILELFFENPMKNYSIREIARKTRIPSSSVQRYMKILVRRKFITKEGYLNVNGYIRFKKAFFYADKLYSSGLVEYLVENLNPSCIILFGSFRKGESVRESDIDIFVESSVKKELDLGRFERIFKHKIDLFVEKDINKLQPHLLNNVVNGIKLYGAFKVK